MFIKFQIINQTLTINSLQKILEILRNWLTNLRTLKVKIHITLQNVNHLLGCQNFELIFENAHQTTQFTHHLL